MSKFVPESFTAREKDILWAMAEFKITRKEVLRQITLMRDHEFMRSYTCWNRVLRNWMRKAEDIKTLRREHQYTQPEGLSDEQRAIDARRGDENLSRLKQMALTVVK